MHSLARSARTVGATTAIAVAAATALTVAPAHSSDDVLQPLALNGFSAMVVDSSHSHLLMGGGSGQNGVLVTDLGGVSVTTVSIPTGVGDLALSPDGAFVYAAATATAKIYKIDLATLAIAATYSLPSANCPTSVAPVSSTLIAFGYTCNQQWGGVGVLDTTTSTTHVTGTLYDPLVRAIPHSTQFLAGEVGLSPSSFSSWNAGTGTPTAAVTARQLGNCSNLGDIAVSPDGASFVIACGAPYQHAEFATGDFSAVATYPTNPYPTTAAFSPDGSYLATGMNGMYDDDVDLFRHSDASLVWDEDFTNSNSASPSASPRGLGFSSDGQTIYAVARTINAAPYYLVTLSLDGGSAPPSSPPSSPPTTTPPTTTPPTTTPPTTTPPTTTPPTTTPPVLPASAVTINAPAASKIGKAITFTGMLTLVGSRVPVGTTVALSSTVSGVTSTGLAQVGPTGAYQFTVYPSRLGTMTTTVSYAGDATHRASHASVVTSVTQATPHLSVTSTRAKGHVSLVTVHLTGWYAARTVRIESSHRLLATGKVNAKGVLSVRVKHQGKLVLTARYSGDVADAPTHTSVTLH